MTPTLAAPARAGDPCQAAKARRPRHGFTHLLACIAETPPHFNLGSLRLAHAPAHLHAYTCLRQTCPQRSFMRSAKRYGDFKAAWECLADIIIDHVPLCLRIWPCDSSITFRPTGPHEGV
jgi:hypothetical protein